MMLTKTLKQWFVHLMETQTSLTFSLGSCKEIDEHHICRDYVLRTFVDRIKENDFTLKKTRSRWYHVKTMRDADYADDLALLTNILAQAESLLHGLYMNISKTEYICFKQRGAISLLSGKPLNLVNKFIYLGSNISSTESNVNAQNVIENNMKSYENLTYSIK